MKKATVLLCSAALTCLMSFPAFAAQTKDEYKEESTVVRQELESTTESIKALQKENKEISKECSELRKSQKESKQLKDNKDTWSQVNELKDSLTDIRVSYTESSSQVRVLKAKAKAHAKDGNYDQAISDLNEALNQKKASLTYMQQMNDIWDQIDQLLK